MYLDNAATTMVSDDIIETVNQYMKVQYGNAGSIHFAGIKAKKCLNEARSIVAECIGANSEQIIFTSGGSESNTLATVGLMKYLKDINKPCVATSTIEHPSILSALNYMDTNGILVLKIPVDNNGIVNIETLKRRIKEYHIGIVSIMAVNNEIGSIQNITEIGRKIIYFSIQIVFKLLVQ